MPEQTITANIQAALRAAVSARRVGRFLVHIDEHSDHPFRNYAIPDDAAVPSPSDVAELVAEFVALQRKPRLEYVRPAPDVDAALTAAGFTVDLVLPLMTLAEPVAPPVPDGLEVRAVHPEDDLRAAALVQNISYDAGDSVSDADIARLRSTVDSGGAVVLARWAGEPVGAGLFTAPRHGLAEIAAVAVLPEYRRRGIASVLGAELSAAVLRLGATPFLQTETENEERLYGRLGYTRVGELVAASLE